MSKSKAAKTANNRVKAEKKAKTPRTIFENPLASAGARFEVWGDRRLAAYATREAAATASLTL